MRAFVLWLLTCCAVQAQFVPPGFRLEHFRVAAHWMHLLHPVT